MDRTASATGEEEFGGIGVHVELEVGGDDLEIPINEVFDEDGVAGLIVEVAVPAHAWVYPWHRAVGSRGAVFLAVLVVENKIEGWDGGVIRDL